MAITIRQVQRGDAEALAEAHASAWLAAYRGLMSDEFLDGISIEKWAERWTEHLSHDELPPVRVAVRDGAVAGFCVVATPSRNQDTGDQFRGGSRTQRQARRLARRRRNDADDRCA